MVRIVLLRLLESYFRHRWLNILPIFIAFLSGMIYILNISPEYMANGRLYVSRENLLADLTSSGTGGSFWITAADATVLEMYELLSTQVFIRTVIQKTDLEQAMSQGPDAVYETITYVREILVFQSAGNNLVEISATGDDPNIVYQLVVATMDAYVQWKINSSYQESMAAGAFFEELILPYQDDVDQTRMDLIDFLDENPNPIRGDRPAEEVMELERLQAAVSRAEERLSAARTGLESANLAQVQAESVTKQTYMVIDQPEIPQVAEVSIKAMLMMLAIFIVVGVFLSVAIVSAGALIDRSIRFPVDARHWLSLPVLAMVPVGKPVQLPAITVSQEGIALVPPSPEATTSASVSTPDPNVLQPLT